MSKEYGQWVEIQFDCLPLRTVTRRDVPLDASPAFQRRWERILTAIETHGIHNAYYLFNGLCTFHLTNDPELGMVNFSWEGTVLTDDSDTRTRHTDLSIQLARETCDWLTEPVVHWLQVSVAKAVAIEFDRYIEAGDLQQTQQRIDKIEAASDEAGGFLGMYL